MALFDGLLDEVNKRFETNGRADALLSALLGLITDPARGGVNGFLEGFRRVGLGNVADSWVGRGANSALANQQLEDAVGANVLSDIANRVGLPVAAATSALAYLTPQVIDKLSPDGVMPDTSSVHAAYNSLIGGAGAAGAVTTTTTTGTGGDREDTMVVVDNRHDGEAAMVAGAAGGSSILSWLLPLLLLGLFLFGGFQFCSTPNREVAVAPLRNTSINATANNANVAGHSDVEHSGTDHSTDTALVFSEEDAVRRADGRAEAAFAALNERSTVQQAVDALNLSIINFATNSAEIPERNRALLARAANILKTAPANTRIEVGGHTDSEGDDNSNLELSNRRAVAVRDELARLGVPADFLTAKGYGETAPKSANDTAEGRFQNRRIAYTISTGGATTAVTNSNTTIGTTTTTTNTASSTPHNDAAH